MAIVNEKFPEVSVVIATLNNAPVLRKVLKEMLKQNYKGTYEIIVVNDGSSDITKKMLQTEFSKEKKITSINLKRSGVCKARNTGIRKASGKIIINMDHDCIPAKNWISQMVSGFKNEKIGVVSAYGGFGGTSTGFRADVLRKVNGYDEDYFYYREDTDLTFKIIENGYEYNKVKADFVHEHELVKPKGFLEFVKHAWQRVKYHKNDVLLYKKHQNKRCREFLHVKFGFIVSPGFDFSVATGLWHSKGKLELSSPRGITYLRNRTILHTILIVLGGLGYVVAVKLVRLWASFKFGKLLI